MSLEANEQSSKGGRDKESWHAFSDRDASSVLYTVNADGTFAVSEAFEQIREADGEAVQMPHAKIENVASRPDADERVTNLATAYAHEPLAGVIAAIKNDETYLEFKETVLIEERSRVEAEYNALPYETLERDLSAGMQSMEWLEIAGLGAAMIVVLTMAAWTAAADLTLAYKNLSIAFPVEAEIDFSAMYASEGDDVMPAAPAEQPLYKDPNFYASMGIFSTLFVFFKWLNVMKRLPLSILQPMPRGLGPKIRWLFSPLGRIFSIQVLLIAAAIAFNLRVGFELDRSPGDVDVAPPISSHVTFTLMAITMAFAAYAFIHWAILIHGRLVGVRLCPNPERSRAKDRLSMLDRQLESVVSVLSAFKGFCAKHEAGTHRVVAECLAVLAGIQDQRKRDADLADAAAQEAAASARIKALQPSTN